MQYSARMETVLLLLARMALRVYGTYLPYTIAHELIVISGSKMGDDLASDTFYGNQQIGS